MICQKFENAHNSEKVSFVTQYGIIQSPNFPEKYPQNEQCIYSLKGKYISNALNNILNFSKIFKLHFNVIQSTKYIVRKIIVFSTLKVD